MFYFNYLQNEIIIFAFFYLNSIKNFLMQNQCDFFRFLLNFLSYSRLKLNLFTMYLLFFTYQLMIFLLLINTFIISFIKNQDCLLNSKLLLNPFFSFHLITKVLHRIIIYLLQLVYFLTNYYFNFPFLCYFFCLFFLFFFFFFFFLRQFSYFFFFTFNN